MKRTTRKPPIPPPLALALLSALAANAAVPVRWTVETSRAAPVAIEQFAGTSIDLEAALKSYGSPLDVEGEPRLYWQTNGMGSAWWSAPASASGGVLRASWTPACEAGGAASYRGFIGIPGSVYSAAFTLRLRPSPGALPNALPLPAPVIDFAAVEVANAPWVEEESDPTVPAWAKAAAKPAYTATEVGAYTKAEADEMLGEATGGLATADALAGVQADVSTLNVGYARLYNFATGATNANFSATNYPPTAAEAAARCHYRPEPGTDFSTVPASLQLNENRDGEWRTVWDSRDWPVWYFRAREARLTNDIARLKAENASLSNRLDQAKAWADRTANGVENPMSDTLVVDRPNMWLMAGYEWQKCVSGSNQCFVIRAKDVALSGGSNTNGFLEICDAFGKPYMRVNKSAETFADPVFTDIHFDDGEGAWYVVFGNATRPTRGGANAEIAGNGTGKCILYAEDDPDCPATITWPSSADSHAGHWIMKAVPKPVSGVVPSRMFFGAEIKVAGKDYVEYVKEASFGAGIRVGNNVYEAVESGDTLVWRKRNDYCSGNELL